MSLDAAERERRATARKHAKDAATAAANNAALAAKRAACIPIVTNGWRAELGWQRQIGRMPEDRRSLTGRLFGDPIPGDPRAPWRPSSKMNHDETH